jgi:photosystem II stability/assembly factor-like uncharacterized protein
MSSSAYRYFFLCLTAVLLAQCGPELLEVEVRRVLEHDGAWHDISVEADGTGYAVGGDTWERGNVARTSDYGESWVVQTITNKGMYGLDVTGNLKLAVGIDGQIMYCTGQETWSKRRTPYWRVLFDLDCHPAADYAIAVGGQRFKNGVLQTMRTTDFAVLHYDTIENGLETVAHVTGDRWLAAGFGVLMSSDDGGEQWSASYPADAYFTSLCMENEQRGWLASQYGGLWHTSDGGKSWHERQRPKTTFSSGGFRDLCLDEEGVLWLAGDQGTLAYSIDAGKTLQYLDVPDHYDIRALSVAERHILLATRSGEILTVSYPEEL